MFALAGFQSARFALCWSIAGRLESRSIADLGRRETNSAVLFFSPGNASERIAAEPEGGPIVHVSRPDPFVE
jgi:hypothetical protein